MGLIEIASGNSVWRGMDYYENHKVVSWNKSGNSTYEGVVSGSNGDSYNVYIDKLHPTFTLINCIQENPFAIARLPKDGGWYANI